jgi:hypothetical protein
MEGGCSSHLLGASWGPCWVSRWPVERSSHAVQIV